MAWGLKSIAIIDLRGVIKMSGAKREDQPVLSWRFAMIDKSFADPSVTVQKAGPVAENQDSSTRTAPSRDNSRLSSFSVSRSVARHMSASNSCSNTEPVR